MWNRIMALGLGMLIGLGLGAQHKSIYQPDTVILKVVTQLAVEDVAPTGDPDVPWAITGDLVGLDSSGGYPQPFWHMQVGRTGLPEPMHYYTDSTPFVFAGAFGFASDHDAAGNWYVAGSSNSYQTVASTRPDGSLRWVRAVHHHDFYDLKVMPDGHVLAMGQDESFLGVHDFSLIMMDSTGTISKGIMVGTEGFDVPSRFIPTANGWLMCGKAFFSPDFHLLLAEVDTAFNLLWAYTYTSLARDHFVEHVAALPDGSGYLAGGYVRGGPQDSLFLMRITTVGAPVWMHTYAQDTSPIFRAHSMVLDSARSHVLLAGEYGSTGAEQPFVMQTDLEGNVNWIRGYGEDGSISTSRFQDVALDAEGNTFAAVGALYDFLSPAHHRILLVTASADSGALPCDTLLTASMGSVGVVRDSAILTQGFVIQYTLPFVHHSSNMQVIPICSVVVGTPAPLAMEGGLRVVNPCRNGELQLQWEWAGDTQATAELTDLGGRLLLRERLAGRTGQAALPLQVPAGMYLLRVTPAHGLPVVKRLVVTE